ncbi:MAG: terpene cyclase/mutase family protein [Anaerolineae bacterium]|nr:hypothetical protein [Anaerolineae bacterium]MDW8101136.1 terpene cyclase/mutase family protein [Anaerolineae bacterium]
MSIYMEAVERCLDWIRREMLPSPDGTRGVYERIRINLDTNSWWVRPDCTIEVARSFGVYGQIRNDETALTLSRNLADWVVGQQRPDGSFPFYRFLPPNDQITDMAPPEAQETTFPNDQGKIARGLWWAYLAHGAPRYYEAARRVLGFLMAHQATDGAFLTDLEPRYRGACFVIWPVIGLLRGYQITGEYSYRSAAERGLRWLYEHILPDGRMRTSFETAGVEQWRPPSSETAEALKAFSLAYGILRIPSYRDAINRLGAFLLRLQHPNGAIRNADDSCRHASLQTDPDLTDLVYTDSYALLALQEAFQATGEQRFREAADRLADFLVRVQCRGESPRWDGGWRGAYDVNTLEPRGRVGQEDPLEEGGMYSVYTGWCAAPITYGLLRRELWRR